MKYALDAPRCQHLHDSGLRCGSPALRGKPFCYNHHLLHTPRLNPGDWGYQFPPIESQKSIEMLVRQVLQSFHDGRLDSAQVRTYLYGIQLLAPYTCRDAVPDGSYVAMELTPAMRKLCGEPPESAPDNPPSMDMTPTPLGPPEPQTVTDQPSPTTCHPERGRRPESKDPESAALQCELSPPPNSEGATPIDDSQSPIPNSDPEDQRLETLRRLTQLIKALKCMSPEEHREMLKSHGGERTTGEVTLSASRTDEPRREHLETIPEPTAP
jgi:hypothetical protein